MNKKILLFSFIAFLLIPAWANKIERILLGTGNDMWTMGLSRNDDDQLSYSALFSIEFKNAYLNAEFQGITNRGYKKGWIPGKNTSSTSTFYSGRYDSLPITFGINKTLYLNNLSIQTTIEMGTILAGKMGLDSLQNNSHDVLRIHSVSLNYDTDNVYAYFLARTKNILNIKLYEFDNAVLNIGAYIDYNYAFDYQASMSIGTGFYATRNGKNILGAQIGYQNTKSFSTFPTQVLYTRYLNGATTEFFFDTGLIDVSYVAYPNTGFGYTRVAMNFLPNYEGFAWQQSDLYLGLGMTYFMRDSLWTLRSRIPISSSFSVFFENRNISGYAINENAELNSNLNTDGRTKKGYNFFLIGGEYRIKENILEAYANASIGFATFKIYKLLNTIPSSPIPFEYLGSEFNWVSDIAIGITLLPEDFLINGYATYRVSIEGGATMLIGAKDTLNLLNTYDSDAKNKLGTLLPKLTVLLEIGLDL